MTRAKLIATACFTILIAALCLLTVRAQDTGAAVVEKSILTFSAPVELPRMTLPAGTYVFRRPDANAARIIQVWTEGEKKILGTFLTVPTKRLEVTSDNVVTFKERDANAGTAPAVHYWYYPARETGHEFVYPKDQAMKIAARTGEKVLSTEGEFTESSTVTPVESSSSNQSAAADQSAANAAAEPAPAEPAQPEPAQSASNDNANVQVNRQASASTATPAPEPARESVGTAGSDQGRATDRASELPKTASPLPLASLISLLSFGGAAFLRGLRN